MHRNDSSFEPSRSQPPRWRFRPASHALIEPIRAFSDNYFWLIVAPDGRNAAVVDPGDAQPVIDVLRRRNLHLTAILLTHHHADHAGGVMQLREFAAPVVYGPAGEDIAGVDQPLFDGDQIDVAGLPLHLQVMDVPGHTRGHIAYFGQSYPGRASAGSLEAGPAAGDDRPVLFCGDTLFAAGCGRLFEGSPAQMLGSLDRLANLPPATMVYCAHEYTLSNLRFAAAADPASAAVADRLAEARTIRELDQETVPSTVAIERETNPFLRTRTPGVRAAVASRLTDRAGASDADWFAAVRAWKDGFR